MTNTTQSTTECPYCYGTGRNKYGGPCKQCKATGQLPGGVKTAGALVQLRTAWQEIYGRIGAIGLIFIALIVAGLVYYLVVGDQPPKTTVCFPHCH